MRKTLKIVFYSIKRKALFLKMKHYLKRAIKTDKEWIKEVSEADRGTGKTIILAKLSVRYNIPIVVPTQKCKSFLIFLINDIPDTIPKVYTISELRDFRGRRREKVLLIDEGLSDGQIELLRYMGKTLVGFKNNY